MRATLMHNPRAGDGKPSRDTLLALLRDAGYEPAYRSTKEKGWKEALDDPGGLVVAAGGDGTVTKVAERLIGRGVPLAILPVGTANNIATSLGVTGPPEELVAGLASARRRGVDVGVARGPWGERRFFETVGVGIFTHTVALAESGAVPEPERSERELHRDVHLLQSTLAAHTPRRWRVALDGRDLSGEYLLLEALNFGCFGPNLCLVPGADPGDGWLDVVLVTVDDRALLEEHLRERLRGGGTPPELPVRRGRRLRLGGPLDDLHVDDEVELGEDEGEVDVGLEVHALELLLPG